MSVKELIKMSNLRLLFLDSKTSRLIYDYNDCYKFEDTRFLNTYGDKRIVKFGNAFTNGLYVFIHSGVRR